jgi:hypothetical protein
VEEATTRARPGSAGDAQEEGGRVAAVAGDPSCYVPSCYTWESKHTADVTGPVVLDMDIWTFGHVTSRGSRASGERCCIGA